jgi:probable HAF family extracellular repeat protein
MKTTAKILPSLILAVSVSGVALADAPQITVTDLGSVDFGFGTHSTNATGSFAGSSGAYAAYYDGTVHELGTLGGSGSSADGINPSNHVVGSSNVAGDTALHAFYYDGSMHDLGTLGGANSSARAINSNNHVVGYSEVAGGSFSAPHAFLYDGTMHDIGTLGGIFAIANAINDSGVVVGASTTAGDIEQHAFMYNGSMHDIGTLGGSVAIAYDISSNGIIAGQSYIAGDGSYHAFLYNGSMQDIGTLGGSFSNATGVNSKGWVIGSSELDSIDGAQTEFLYDGSTMYDLNALVASSNISILMAVGINDEGDIYALGSGTTTDGLNLYRLSVNSVPIPASAWLFGSCLTGLVGLRRKSKNS